MLFNRFLSSTVRGCLFYGAILLLGLLLPACDVVEYSPYQVILKDSEKNLTRKNLEKLWQQTPGDTVKIILMGDTQRFYDEVEDFVARANEMEDIDFVIHAGDISDFGLAQEFRWINGIMQKLKVPYLTVVGNHDLITNGSLVYKQMFGDFNYSFSYGGHKFIFINTNSRESNFNGTVPDLNWLENELTQTQAPQAVIVSHMSPFNSDFDPELELPFANILKNSGKVDLSLHGHRHNFQEVEYYGDGVTYFVTTVIKKRGFALVSLWNGGNRIERIEY